MLFFTLSRIYNFAYVVCKQMEVIPVFLCWAHWLENSQAKVINYKLIEDQSQTFNKGLFLPYCKLYNKCIWKKVWIFPLSTCQLEAHLSKLVQANLVILV